MAQQVFNLLVALFLLSVEFVLQPKIDALEERITHCEERIEE